MEFVRSMVLQQEAEPSIMCNKVFERGSLTAGEVILFVSVCERCLNVMNGSDEQQQKMVLGKHHSSKLQ